VAFLFAETIRRISDGESVTSLFAEQNNNFYPRRAPFGALSSVGLRPVFQAPGRGPFFFWRTHEIHRLRA
jgi:hypothetical protein